MCQLWSSAPELDRGDDHCGECDNELVADPAGDLDGVVGAVASLI
jgi:hypothetical protein